MRDEPYRTNLETLQVSPADAWTARIQARVKVFADSHKALAGFLVGVALVLAIVVGFLIAIGAILALMAVCGLTIQACGLLVNHTLMDAGALAATLAALASGLVVLLTCMGCEILGD